MKQVGFDQHKLVILAEQLLDSSSHFGGCHVEPDQSLLEPAFHSLVDFDDKTVGTRLFEDRCQRWLPLRLSVDWDAFIGLAKGSRQQGFGPEFR